jgi:coenzyme F420-reducing hydrogenase beta subunit
MKIPEQEIDAAIKQRMKEVLAFRPTPAIIVIDATHGLQPQPQETEFDFERDGFLLKMALPAMCFETFEEFEQEALAQDDRKGIEMVRSAVMRCPGKLVVYMMDDDTRTVAYPQVTRTE